jgi:predicted NAD/FAD-binding protein
LKIGIVGAGIAGLASAWLLDGDHEITLFEKNDHLGGHALTVPVELGGRRTHANPAFGYLSPNMYPRFVRLLELLRVRTIPRPASVTIYSRPRGRSTLLTPRANLGRLASIAHPKMIVTLLELQRVLLAARSLDRDDDWQTTLDEFLGRHRVSTFVRDEIVLPWTAAITEATVSDVGGLSARAALKYPVHAQSEDRTDYNLFELEDGVAAYVEPLRASLKSTTIRMGSASAIRTMARRSGRFVLTEASGLEHEVDHVVLASPAFATKNLVDTLAGAGDLSTILGGLPYTKARIAVHGDASVMPPRKSDWSVYNAMFDGTRCEGTVWVRHASDDLEYFKSWVSFARDMPRDISSVHEFHHPVPTPGFYRAQAQLRPRSGQDNLWFAGSYTQDVDSHESGLRSAIDIATKLNPGSNNLRSLTS